MAVESLFILKTFFLVLTQRPEEARGGTLEKNF